MIDVTLLDALRNRKTTNGYFDSRPVSIEDQHLLIEAAERAPSHFNSQPWRFVLIDDRDIKRQIAEIGGDTMTRLISEGTFFERYRKYFRFSKEEMEEKRDGIYIDKVPGPLKPFIKKVFTPSALKVLNTLGVPKTLGEDNKKLIRESPLLLAVLLDKEEYKPHELSGFYCTLSMGMAIEHIWLTCVALNMGIQFVSTPMEVPEAWQQISDILRVPDELQLMAVYRLGYLPTDGARPRIDWKSNQRKRLSQLAFRNTCSTPEPDVPQVL